MKRTGTAMILGAAIFVGLLFGQKIETVDGLRIVYNDDQGLWKGHPQISIENTKQIGKVDSEDDNYLFFRPSDLAVDAEGNIYVLDAGNHRIQKFDPEGKYLESFGRQGQGPGEFQFPLSLAIDTEGRMYIPDAGNQHLVILNADGSLYKNIKLDRDAIGPMKVLSSGKFLRGTGDFFILSGDSSQNQELPKLFKVLDSDGNEEIEFGERKDFDDSIMNMMGNRCQFTADVWGNIYASFVHQNRIEKYSPDGKPQWRAERELNYSMKPPKKKGKVERTGNNVMIQAPEMNECSHGIAVDGKGRIWVVTLNRQIKEEERVGTVARVEQGASGRNMSMSTTGNTDLRKTDMYKLEVFDQDGVLLGSFPLDHFVNDIWIHNDKIYLLDRDRGAQFHEYRIIE